MSTTTSSRQFSRSDLRARGWTPAMVRQYLGDPDAIVHIRGTSHDMHLFDAERVERVEAEPTWSERADQAARRSAAGKACADKKAAETTEWARAVEIKVPLMPMEELFDRARESYESLWASRGEERYADGDNEAFLQRIAVNYLRHECSRYEHLLTSTKGEVARREAQEIIGERVLDAIANQYPELSDECFSQQVRRLDRELLMMSYANERPGLGEARATKEHHNDPEGRDAVELAADKLTTVSASPADELLSRTQRA